MQLNSLKRVHKWKKPAPVGRGSKRGKTSGRGTKGQNARSGRKKRPEIRDVIMRLPKLRGRGTNSFVSRFTRPVTFKLGEISAMFKKGEVVSKETLIVAKIISREEAKGGVKILGGGEIDKVLNFEGCEVTKSVREAIEKAGGSIS